MNIPEIEIIRKIDIKQRQLRSLRGFILYLLELGPRKEIATNLPAFFLTDDKTVLKQRKKNGLHEFLFGKEAGDEDTKIQLEKMQDQIEIVRREISSLKSESNLQYKFNQYPNDLRDEKIKNLKKDHHLNR